MSIFFILIKKTRIKAFDALATHLSLISFLVSNAYVLADHKGVQKIMLRSTKTAGELLFRELRVFSKALLEFIKVVKDIYLHHKEPDLEKLNNNDLPMTLKLHILEKAETHKKIILDKEIMKRESVRKRYLNFISVMKYKYNIEPEGELGKQLEERELTYRKMVHTGMQNVRKSRKFNKNK